MAGKNDAYLIALSLCIPARHAYSIFTALQIGHIVV